MSANLNFVVTSKSPKYFNGLFINKFNTVPIINNMTDIPFKNLEEPSNNDTTLLLDLFVTMYKIRDDVDDQSLFNQLFIELFEIYPETIISLLEDDGNFRNYSSKCANRIRDTFLNEVLPKVSSFAK